MPGIRGIRNTRVGLLTEQRIRVHFTGGKLQEPIFTTTSEDHPQIAIRGGACAAKPVRRNTNLCNLRYPNLIRGSAKANRMSDMKVPIRVRTVKIMMMLPAT